LTDTTEPDFLEILSQASPEVRATALRARELVRDVLPGTIEQVDRSARMLGYGRDRTYRGLICGITLQPTYVNLMFSRGVDLADPARRLEGTGKRARHVKLRAAADIDDPAIRQLLEEAGRSRPELTLAMSSRVPHPSSVPLTYLRSRPRPDSRGTDSCTQKASAKPCVGVPGQPDLHERATVTVGSGWPAVSTTTDALRANQGVARWLMTIVIVCR
jgi:hypothetical protein